jgi:hypothetical protein
MNGDAYTARGKKNPLNIMIFAIFEANSILNRLWEAKRPPSKFY